MPAEVTRKRHRAAGLLVLSGLLLVAAVAGIAIGARSLSPGDVLHTLACPGGWPLSCPARTPADQIVRELRLPRTGLAVVTGLALGMAGALMQGYTRNPLADSGLLGLNAGAAFLAALSIHFLALTRPEQYIWFAFAGALVAGLVVFGVSALGGATASPLSLVLAGAAVTAFLQALTNTVVLLDPASMDTYRFWIIGSISGHDATVLRQVLPFIALGAVLACCAAPGLNALSLGEDVARGLGVHIGRNRALGLAAVVLLTGAATAAVGPLAFLGLLVPHLARMLTGPDHRWLLPYSALLGALVLLVADIIGRVLARPGELQAGIILAAFGAPCFVYLVRRRKAVGL
ncbi:iron ABC transporter permease [Nocardia terpenica]|uniref:Iron ABC transporter permease n=1 Tax=Nocardia terpenica TaxID=455432 RepID=A0A164M7H2_9NOCA|nr:iron ABC transporter permease [Nocardia terpenica]KZM73113.1 iron ABC transporter permease [Nocardia terpenica]MBF6064320.1 iron ABC transporter permease [Nocardia terpenica]MBF6106653.1 iron ABC transporter permease [Nocardia terpenica]MBF6113938.1 iron ABC transporter permease [Nocardia terpenica]MBF6120438.1 iron ABC transporter permease [Nocardia terpenica]